MRFYSMIFQNIPMMGGNPVLRVLLSKMEPHLIKELESASPDQLERMYEAMLVGLGQVYAPHATAIVLDLRKSHVLIEEVERAVGPLPLLEDEEMQALPSALPSEVGLNPDVIESPSMPIREPLTPPPPPPPVAASDEDDPLVGIELEPGIVVRMRQSEARALREAGM